MKMRYALVPCLLLVAACDYQRDLGSLPNAEQTDASPSQGSAPDAGGASSPDGSTTNTDGGNGGTPPDTSSGDGKCSTLTAPVVLATGQTGIQRPAVDADSVYWTAFGTQQDTGTVMKVSKAGGAPTSLLTNQMQPQLALVDGAFLYWTDDTGIVRRMATVGGIPTAFFQPSSGGGFENMMVFGGDLYWTGSTSDAGNLVFRGGKTALGTGVTTPLFEDHLGTQGSSRNDDVTADATGAYWIRTDGGASASTISRMPVGAFVGQAVGQGGSFGAQILSDGSGLYVRELGDGLFYRIDRQTGTPTLVVEPAGGLPIGKFGLDSGNLYWLSAQCTSSVPEGCAEYNTTLYRAAVGSVSAGTPLVTMPGYAGAAAFAFDATCVYWTNYTDGTLSKLRK
jgi:hypothetical protein